MARNVKVTIHGEQRTFRGEKSVEPVELVTRGVLHEKDGTYFLKYDEYYEDARQPVKNLLKFDDEGMELTKKGPVSSVMSFCSGETRSGFYATPHGSLDIEILTETYNMVSTDEGIGVIAAYVMDYGNECVTFNILRIVMEN